MRIFNCKSIGVRENSSSVIVGYYLAVLMISFDENQNFNGLFRPSKIKGKFSKLDMGCIYSWTYIYIYIYIYIYCQIFTSWGPGLYEIWGSSLNNLGKKTIFIYQF